VIAEVHKLYLSDCVPEAMEAGTELAKLIKAKIEADKTIKIPDTDNPNLNDK
jgi:hypothetical protein